MPPRAALRLLLGALTAVGAVLPALHTFGEAPGPAWSVQTALSGLEPHEDPLPPGIAPDAPTDTASLYARAGLDRRTLTRQTAALLDRAARHGTDGAGARVAAATVPPGSPSTPGLATHVVPSCSGDGADGKRVQPLYVREETTPSRYSTVLPLLLNEVANVDDVFAVSAQRTGGVRRVRWVHSGCVPVIAEVVVPAGTLASFSLTINALAGLGFDDPNRKYLAFTEASVLCGIGTYYTDRRPTDNANDGYRASYARVDTRCWAGGDISVAAHELTHNLGGVLPTAPHGTSSGHCWDDNDLMCYADGSGAVLQATCADPTLERLLDCNGDDYFNTAPASGSWLAQNWNTASSGFLDTSAPELAPPPATPPALTTTPARRTKIAAGWHGRQRLVTGTLTAAGGDRVRGERLQLQRRWVGSSRWVSVGRATTDRRGEAERKQRPRRTADYRWVYAGTADLLASTSDRVRARR